MKTMNPNDLGKRFLVEECQKIQISSFLKSTKNKLKKALLESEIEVGGITINLISSQTGFGGARYWFECPRCLARVGVIFAHPLTEKLGCRKCLRLEYRKRRFKGMIENTF